MTTDLLEAIVEVVFGSLDDFVESTLVLGVDVGESQSGASLHSDHASNPGLALDDAVRDDHLAKRVRSRLGWMSCPIPKFLGLFSKSGLTGFFSTFFWTTMGGGATFFPPFFPFPFTAAFGMIILLVKTGLDEISECLKYFKQIETTQL